MASSTGAASDFVWRSLKFYLKYVPKVLGRIDLHRKTKKNPGRWGERPGWGYCRGGPEETRFFNGGVLATGSSAAATL